MLTSSLRFLVILMLASAFLTSCTSNKKLTARAIYFKNVNDSLLKHSTVSYEMKLQKGDILFISVATSNETSARLLNQGGQSAGGSSGASAATGTSNTSGYLIDETGAITFPLIGKVKAEGLTRAVFTDSLSRRVRETVSDAIVTVRLLNYKVTVLGEVVRPGAFSIPNERVTILDAIGLAGDLTPFGKRDNIKVIRENNNGREMGVLNLNSGEIFTSPYFYLKQNDIVYIEMNDRKMANADQTNVRNFSLILGVVSAVSLIVTTIIRL